MKDKQELTNAGRGRTKTEDEHMQKAGEYARHGNKMRNLDDDDNSAELIIMMIIVIVIKDKKT